MRLEPAEADASEFSRATYHATPKATWSACFGVYWSPTRRCLIANGEQEVQRYDLDGNLAWSASGYDIFTNGVTLLDDGVQAIDFEHNIHLFDWETGKLLRGPN